jgi:hypothetical protein
VYGGGSMFGNEDKLANKKFEQVIKNIIDKDKDSLKAMFSAKALTESDDFDEKIEYIFGFFQGKIEANERRGGSFYDSVEKGKVIKKEYYSWYRVETDKHNYFFIIIEYPIDVVNPDNVGLYTLRVIKSDEDSIHFSWEEVKKAGIYILEK